MQLIGRCVCPCPWTRLEMPDHQDAVGRSLPSTLGTLFESRLRANDNEQQTKQQNNLTPTTSPTCRRLQPSASLSLSAGGERRDNNPNPIQFTHLPPSPTDQPPHTIENAQNTRARTTTRGGNHRSSACHRRHARRHRRRCHCFRRSLFSFLSVVVVLIRLQTENTRTRTHTTHMHAQTVMMPADGRNGRGWLWIWMKCDGMMFGLMNSWVLKVLEV